MGDWDGGIGGGAPSMVGVDGGIIGWVAHLQRDG